MEVSVSPSSTIQPAPSESSSDRLGSKRRLLIWAVNVWLVYHISAIIIAPAAVAPSSPLIQAVWRVFHPYLDLLFLNHGYHFFAPEPTESTLLAFAAERADGTVVTGRIPSPSTKPRLLFHRHFMLTEHMRDAPEELQKEWIGSYAEHICHKYGAVRVSLTGQIHNLATVDAVRGGTRLDDPASYESESFGVFECAQK
jgi:hypothetical protein